MPVSALPAMRAAIAYSAPAAAAASGWWLSGGISASNVVAVWQPKGAASLAASYTNLANPGTYDAAPGTAPTFDTATGWTGSATSYLDAGFAFDAGYSVLVRFSDAPQDNTYKIFLGTSQLTVTASKNLAGDGGTMDFRVQYGNQIKIEADTGTTAGVALLTPTGIYLDGSLLQSHTGVYTAADNLFLLANNNGSGSAVNHFNGGKVQAIAVWNTDVSSAQSDLYTAAAAL